MKTESLVGIHEIDNTEEIKLPGEIFMAAKEKLDVLSEKSNIDLIILCVTVIMLVCSDPLCA